MLLVLGTGSVITTFFVGTTKVEETKVSVLIHLFNMLTQPDKAIADTTQLLTQLSQRANYFCINLDDQVDRNANIAPLRDSNAIIYRGALRSMSTKITVKTLRAGLPAGDKHTIEVWTVHASFHRSDSCVGGPSRSASLVKTLS